MKLNEKTINGTTIRFRRQPAKSDRKHLIVIFSGFRPHGTFDFGGKSLSTLNSEIIWIDDTFNGHYSYYILANGGECIANDINEFIETELSEMNLAKDSCTLAGFSKGGSAALYYLAKFNYPNAVVSVPQFNISDYVKRNWPREISSMFHEEGELFEKCKTIISDTINSDENKDKSVYLITSPSDSQYETEILPNLDFLNQYNNFNLITSKTPLITQHDEVTRYNVSTIISLFTLLCEGFQPVLGQVTNGSSNVELSPSNKSAVHTREPSGVIEKASIDGKLLHLNGHAYFRGMPVKSYDDIKTSLKLTSETNVIRVRLGQELNKVLNTKLYQSEFIDYSYAQFATMKHLGIDVSGLPVGRYRLELELSISNSMEVQTVVPQLSRDILSYSILDDGMIQLVGTGNELILTKRDTVLEPQLQTYFELQKVSVEAQKLFLQGYFVPRHFNIDKWSSIKYHVRFTEESSGHSKVMPLATANRADASKRTGDVLNDQSKAYFATPRYEGIMIDSLFPGTYKIEIVGVFGEHVVSRRLDQKVQVSLLNDTKKQSVAVIGSCVSRDLFNSRLSPRWKEYATLTDSFYQMSLISLMSPAAHFEDSKYFDLNKHDFNATKDDFEKSFLQRLTDSKPDVVIVDLYADARFDVMELDGTFVTDNSWKIGKSSSYSMLAEKPRISPDTNAEGYYELFRKSVNSFKDFLAENSPRTEVVLNSCRNAKFWRTSDGFGYFNLGSIKKQNSRWDILEQIFIEVMNPTVVSSNIKTLLGDSEHPWGKGPVHYTKDFYERTSANLYKTIYPNLNSSHTFNVVDEKKP